MEFISLFAFTMLTCAYRVRCTSFVTIGDWGGAALGSWYENAVSKVASQFAAAAAENDAQFVVNVGDSFYWCGIQNTSDYQIKADFVEPYMGFESLRVPWYGVLGNHAYGYNVDAVVGLSGAPATPHWVMDARYWSRRVEIGSSGSYMSLVFLDTNPCIAEYRSTNEDGWDPCGTEYPTCSLTSDPDDEFEGPCEFHPNIVAQDCSEQFAWLGGVLAQVPDDDWLLVVGHHTGDEIDVEDFTSLLQESGRVDLYLNGHVHTLSQYTIDGGGAYVTSGAASQVELPSRRGGEDECAPAHKRTPAVERGCERLLGHDIEAHGPFGHSFETIFNDKTPGFTLHTFSEDLASLTTQFLDYDGNVLHEFTVDKHAVAAAPKKNFTRLDGSGDCCPESRACVDGPGAFTTSTGGDYPDAAAAACAAAPGCVAFGQMRGFATNFHFETEAACLASTDLGAHHCGGAQSSPRYLSTHEMGGKLPWSCYSMM